MKKLLLTLIVITTLISCKKNEVPESTSPNPSNTTQTCKLQGKIIKKDFTSVHDGTFSVYIEEVSPGVYQQVQRPHVVKTYYIVVQYGQLTPSQIVVSGADYQTYNVGDPYCLD